MKSDPVFTFVSYGFMFTVSFVLLILCVINLYRHYVMPKDIYPKLGLIRHLLIICVILQIIVYLGYYLDVMVMIRLGWGAWVPLSLFCLSDLGIKVANSYISINKLQLEGSFECCTKTFGYTFWLLASMVDIIGTILGYSINNFVILQIFWMSWKVFACFAILFVILFLYQVRIKVKLCIKNTKTYIDIIKMKQSINKILRIILCLMCTILFYSITITQQIIWIYQITINGAKGINTSVLTVLLNIGMWIFFHSFILIYTWISKTNIINTEQSNLLECSIECSTTHRDVVV